MKITKQVRREAKELFRSCVVNGVLDENRVRQSVVQILAARPRAYLAILSFFHRLVQLDVERRSAQIESVVPLNAEFQNAIKANLAKRYGAGLEFKFMQNPDLVGGVRIRVGSDVYDGSVQARLHEMQRTFETA